MKNTLPLLCVNFEVFGEVGCSPTFSTSFKIHIVCIPVNIRWLQYFYSRRIFHVVKLFVKVTVQGCSPSSGIASFLDLRMFRTVQIGKCVFRQLKTLIRFVKTLLHSDRKRLQTIKKTVATAYDIYPQGSSATKRMRSEKLETCITTTWRQIMNLIKIQNILRR